MDLPPLLEDCESCLCGHGLLDHEQDYGGCRICGRLCRGYVGCLVIPGRRRTDER